MKKNKKIIFELILIILFIILSLIIGTHIISNFELNFYKEITEHMSNNLTLIMKFISYMGNTLIVILICIILVLLRKTRWKYGIITSIGVILSFISNNVLKIIFQRERPNILRLVNESNYSFPSGHAMINMTMYSLLAICIYNNIKNKTIRNILISICILIPLAIGLSRVYLGVHYITDILAGYIAGLFITIVTYQIYKTFKIGSD